ncbi:MAG: CoA-binding protein [Bacteroidetes bacterium]|nr:CoA-binding protein [Bacteroidota bacterium]
MLAILKSAGNILLIDWPEESVPQNLLKAGFKVFGYSPHQYTAAGLDEKGRLVFRPVDSLSGKIDIVNVFRPENELHEIIEKLVLPSGATNVWLQPPVTFGAKAEFASKFGLNFIEGENIAEWANRLK